MCRVRRLFALLPIVAAAASSGCHSSDSGDCDPCGDNYVVNADIWASPEGDMFIAGYRGMQQGLLRRFDNGAWVPIYEGGHSLQSMWGTSSQDFFVLDLDATVLHYDHGTWETWALSSPDGGAPVGQAWALWGSANDDLFVAGWGGAILHFDGTAWAPMTTPTTARLKSLWGSAHDNVIAVGDQGTILHFDGAAWSLVPSPTTAQLNAVWGAAADNVFIVGETTLESAHVILHYDGHAVTTMHEGDKALLGIHGTGPDRVYAVGARRNESSVTGGAFRFDGTSWIEQSVGVGQFLWDVWVNPDGSYVVVGPDDTIVKRIGK